MAVFVESAVAHMHHVDPSLFQFDEAGCEHAAHAGESGLDDALFSNFVVGFGDCPFQQAEPFAVGIFFEVLRHGFLGDCCRHFCLLHNRPLRRWPRPEGACGPKCIVQQRQTCCSCGFSLNRFCLRML